MVPGPPTAPTAAVVLGSGGARGYAHIGALDAIVERGYEVIAIAGSSMGAIVGGIFAAGKLDDYRDWVTGLGQFEMLRLLDLSLSRPGALRGDKVFAKVRALVGDVLIEDLPLAYTAVAVDLAARREVWFQRGPLEIAMRASGANPTLFPPVESNGRLLIDGGILNPLPISPTAATGADLVIAISLHGEPTPAPAPAPEAAGDEPLIDRIRALATRTMDRDLRAILRPVADVDTPPRLGADDARPRRLAPPAPGKFDILHLALETMQAALCEHKLAGYRPDVLVTVPKDACRSLDWHRATELIALGRALAEAGLDQWAAGQAPAVHSAGGHAAPKHPAAG